MPRQARKKSENGIYHIMFRGINKQQIFQENEDYRKFLNVVKECKEISGFKLFAYCLMGNHVHRGRFLVLTKKEVVRNHLTTSMIISAELFRKLHLKITTAQRTVCRLRGTQGTVPCVQ